VGTRWFRLLPFLVLVAVWFSAAAGAQTPPKKTLSYKLLSIHVKGLNHLTEDQVVAASGLKIGQFASEEEFNQAAQRLGETGLFTQLTYTYKYSSDGCDLEIQVQENNKLVPILFENFVWFSDQDLISQLHARLPLFKGQLPESGNLGDQVAQALTAILNERKISGEVAYLPFATQNGPIDSYQFTLRMHPVEVREIKFPGADPGEIPALQASIKELSGQEYQRSKLRVLEQFNLLPIYTSRGYLKVTIGDPQAKVAEDGTKTLVDVSFPVQRGVQYKLADLQFSGDNAFSAGELRPMIHLKSGDVANAVQLLDDLQQVQKLYGTKGYLFAHAAAEPTTDDATATVSYNVKITEGDVYHMGDLSIDGLPEENAQKMAAQWQIKKGDPYDNGYLQQFFKILYRDYGLRRSYNVIPKQAVDQQQKTVSVSLHFIPQG
jgi:outer membrane protein insertion porin family